MKSESLGNESHKLDGNGPAQNRMKNYTEKPENHVSREVPDDSVVYFPPIF